MSLTPKDLPAQYKQGAQLTEGEKLSFSETKQEIVL